MADLFDSEASWLELPWLGDAWPNDPPRNPSSQITTLDFLTSKLTVENFLTLKFSKLVKA